MIQEKSIKVNGINLNYIVGEKNGDPLVFLHGLSDRWQTFATLIPILSVYYTIYAVDLRGHGKSDKAENYRIIDYSSDIILFLKKIFKKPVKMIGHSLGASISLTIGALNPGLLESLIFIEPFFFADKVSNYKEFRSYFINTLKVIKDCDDIEYVRKNIQEKESLGRKRSFDFIQLDKKTIDFALNKKVFEGFNLDEKLNNIRCPSMVITGNPKITGYLKKKEIDYIKKRLKNAVFEYIEDAGHNAHEDRPYLTAKYILNFFNSY